MEVIELHCVEPERLDKFLALQLPDFSRSYINRLISDQAVFIGDEIAKKKSYRLKAGDCIRLEIPELVELETPSEDLGLKVIYEDSDLLVIEKPHGMLTHPLHPGQGGTVVSGALHLSRDLSGINGTLRPGIVHRLDRDTSGVLAIAKNDFSHRKLTDAFSERRVQKTYFAVCYGRLARTSGEVDLSLGRDPRRRTLRMVDPSGKTALTRYRSVLSWDRFHLMQLKPYTGRTHQLRVHLKSIGVPIVHDLDYQGRNLNKWVSRMMLHNFCLGLEHPRTGERMQFKSPLNGDMLSLIHRLNRGERYVG